MTKIVWCFFIFPINIDHVSELHCYYPNFVYKIFISCMSFIIFLRLCLVIIFQNKEYLDIHFSKCYQNSFYNSRRQTHSSVSKNWFPRKEIKMLFLQLFYASSHAQHHALFLCASSLLVIEMHVIFTLYPNAKCSINKI